MSELQTDSDAWAAIVGTLASAPHRARTGLTMRAKLDAIDAKGREVKVRLVIRRGQAFDQMVDLQPGDRVRVIGKLAVPDAGDEEATSHLWLDVDSAMRLGAEPIAHQDTQKEQGIYEHIQYVHGLGPHPENKEIAAYESLT